ncbi:MAG: VOC family protein [Candidatus Limnocylindria bacterium]
MLNDFPLSARLPATDVARARAWYEEKLGLVPTRDDEMGGFWYLTGGAWFYLYATPSAGTAQNTAAGWQVDDIQAVMDEIRSRGVAFEEYDFGEMGSTVGGLMTTPFGKAAWFKDSEGNTIELSEVPAP